MEGIKLGLNALIAMILACLFPVGMQVMGLELVRMVSNGGVLLGSRGRSRREQ